MSKPKFMNMILMAAMTALIITFPAGCCSPESTVSGEYTLKAGVATYEIGTEFQGKELFASSEVTSYPADGAFPAMNVYKDPSIEVRTFVNPGEQNEEVIFVSSTKSGETMRGIRISDPLADLKAAYPEVVFLSGDGSWADENAPVEYSRIYRFYVNGDGTNNYIDFYTDNSPERKIVLIEIANGLDSPREWNDNSAWLGDGTIKKEMPDGFTTRLFRENKDGSETEIVIFRGAAEGHDLDDDGISEIVCFERKNNAQGIVIYDKAEDRITITDVNAALGSAYSEYTGSIGNIKIEYSNCIQASITKEDGTIDNFIYDYCDGELQYLCTLEEALR